MNSKLEKEGVYKYLKKRFWEYTCEARQWYKYFDNFGDLKFVELPIRVLRDSCGLSKFRQSKILDELVSENKIIVKVGQCKIRYYSIVKESEG